MKKSVIILITLFVVLFAVDSFAQQQTFPLPNLNIGVGTSDDPQDLAVTLQLLLILTILSLAPSIIIMTTCYLRLIIVLHFLRQALGTMQMPPTQMLAGFALIITFFIMMPTWDEVVSESVSPYVDGEITLDSAYNRGIEPVREFMFKHARDEDIELFLSMTTDVRPESREELSTIVLIPSFVLSELRTAFIIGFFLFVPFILIDMLVASILMAMGMMMLPPIMISLPFKILLFVLVDGWTLIVGSLIRSFG